LNKIETALEDCGLALDEVTEYIESDNLEAARDAAERLRDEASTLLEHIHRRLGQL
jgi:plasmid stabilization system protein ParE